jgi:serine/threonine protein phosphatase PrpC
MLAKNARAVCLWAGDSRLYRLRDESLQQLTEDHSYVAELVREGQLSVEEAKHHPSANMITRAIGVSPSVDIAVKPFEVLAGDTYLLCSDGLYNEVAEAELQSTLLSSDVYRSSVQLLNLCLGRAARDNITFIIAHAHNDSLGQTDMDQTILDPSQTRLG